MKNPSPWAKAIAISLPTGFALVLYVTTAAPGLTWAHYGADGGDLLAAAITNGVPHPSGYPFYTLLLQAWLFFGGLLHPSPAYLGNLFSACAVAAAIGVTVITVAHVLRETSEQPVRRLWAAAAGCVLAVTPLFWSQALITEVYALHALLVAGIGLFTFAWPGQRVGLALLLGLGLAHHLTSVLLWPAVVYAVWTDPTNDSTHRRRALMLLMLFGGAILLAGLLYLRLPWAAMGHAGQGTPPPVNWGYMRDLAGFGWVVGGVPYRAYVFAVPPDQWLGRIAAMGQVLIEQFTIVGLLAALGGLALWDHRRPRLRTLALLWAIPVALYAAGYRTSDSYVYLIPVVWLLSLTFAQGLDSASGWLSAQRPQAKQVMQAGIGLVALLFVAAVLIMRLPALSLRQDDEARRYVAQVAQEVTPGSIIVTSADAETFALWYAAWANDTTLEPTLPDVVLLNSALEQFGWYRDLMQDLYPDLPGVADGIAGVIEANRDDHPIFFAEQIVNQNVNRGANVAPAGPLFRLLTP